MKFKSKPEDRFIKDLHQKVNLYLKSQPNGRFANSGYWFKIIFLLTFLILAYSQLLLSTSYIVIIISYILLGLILFLLALNLAHDAAHNSLTRNHSLNAFLFYFSFVLNGINPYLWRKRHLLEHHPFPNIPHRDPDLIQVKWLRYCKEQKHYWYHRFQHFYAPLIYMMYTLFWVIIKDFKRNISPGCRLSTPQIIFINLVVKLYYFLYILILPLYMKPELWSAIVFGFLLLHTIGSVLVVFTFVISHYVDGIKNSVIENETIHTSWEMHQINSSVDFHSESKVALFLFGGFNCHNAHHLFPGVSHVHYPAITSILEKCLKVHNKALNKVSFLKGIYLHFALLKKWSRS